jgi:hypothetical protein
MCYNKNKNLLLSIYIPVVGVEQEQAVIAAVDLLADIAVAVVPQQVRRNMHQAVEAKRLVLNL